MRSIVLALALVCLRSDRPAQMIPVHMLAKAPPHDGPTPIEVRRREGEPITYRVTRDGQAVLDFSPLGIRRQDQAFTDHTLTFTGAADPRTVDERYTMPHGKRREHHVVAQEQTVSFRNAAGARLEIILHAQNDGVAFRYRFPEHVSA